ncbi:hypothetical protein DN31_3710 [Vibrio mimicus]|nr:hypothetical protein DN31_3710 [Vibrio mimicus]
MQVIQLWNKNTKPYSTRSLKVYLILVGRPPPLRSR